jgi:ATP adenylyltransferase
VDECPYCAGIDLGGNGVGLKTDFNTVLCRDVAAVLVPTLGMLAPGYLLAITERHLSNFGHLGRSELEQVESRLADVLRELTPLFGEYLVFEHGTPRVSEGLGSCITHAHLHLIPTSESSISAVRDALDWQPVGSLADVADFAEQGYAYLQARGESHVVVAPRLPGQWIRRMVALHHGLADRWDWAVHPGDQNLIDTFERLTARGVFAGKGRCSN